MTTYVTPKFVWLLVVAIFVQSLHWYFVIDIVTMILVLDRQHVPYGDVQNGKVWLFKCCLLFATITKYSELFLFNRHQTTRGLMASNQNIQLTLIFWTLRALGQGAFGEVYQGYFKKNNNDTVEMSVAVKTLPELSSNQVLIIILTASIPGNCTYLRI